VIRLAVRVRRDRAEIVLAELLELVPAGVEESQAGDTVEYAVYGAPGELPRLPVLNALVGDALVEISTSEIADDWHERWREFHRPVVIAAPPPRAGKRESRRVLDLRVRPPWEEPLEGLEGELQEIVIDPGQAFGTGAHASTHLCLELLMELAAGESRSGALVDVGTGSGVLAIAAAQLGFAPVLGLDHELASVEAARQNAEANDVEIDVSRFDLRVDPLPWIDDESSPGGEPVVIANLLRPLLRDLADRMPHAPAHLIAGGLLIDEVEEITEVFEERLQLRERERRERGDWAAVWLAGG
jgi:ribosomal protein L11 methyltransferase